MSEEICRTDMIFITAHEAESLLDWMDCHFIDDLRSDDDVDSMVWLGNMMSIYNKCKGGNHGKDEQR